MPRFHRFVALSVICAGCVFGQVQQGSFAQIAYGGGWQTTFTLVNPSATSLAFVTLDFYGDNGLPLNVPIQGAAATTSYTFSIVPGGQQSVVLSSTDPAESQGWANINVSGTARGQASFRRLLPSKTITEAVVPLSTSGFAVCVVPTAAASVILLPFDNTTGQYVTSLALANTTTGALPVPFEFVDQSNNVLVADTINLTARQHIAIVTPDTYPALAGKRGTLRLHQTTDKLSVLGLLANSTNSITTILPFTN